MRCQSAVALLIMFAQPGDLLGNTCVNWTTGAGWGHFGLGDSTAATWTDSFVAPCTELRRLYRIEQ